MNNLYAMAQRAGMVLMVGLLLIILQGCQKPFVSVVVEIDECCKKGEECRDSVSGCATPTPVPSGGFDTSTGIHCASGEYCTNEGAICTRTTKCRTVAQGGAVCSCQCIK